MDDYRALLEHSFEQATYSDPQVSRLEFLADYIFDFTTYDSEMAALFAGKALEVCTAINDAKTFDYIKDADNYRWFLLMVNMPFFAERLEWGTSVRGAWWDHCAQKLESCGLWRDGRQVLSMEFPRSEWMRFISELVAFAAADTAGVKASDFCRDGCEQFQEGDSHCDGGICARAAGVKASHSVDELMKLVAQLRTARTVDLPTLMGAIRAYAEQLAAGVAMPGKAQQ